MLSLKVEIFNVWSSLNFSMCTEVAPCVMNECRYRVLTDKDRGIFLPAYINNYLINIWGREIWKHIRTEKSKDRYTGK